MDAGRQRSRAGRERRAAGVGADHGNPRRRQPVRPPGRRSLRDRSLRFPGGTRHEPRRSCARKPPMCRSSGSRRSAGSASPISPPHRRSSSNMPATPPRRRPPSTPPSRRSPRPTSTCKRTQVRSPVNGYVTNLLLRVGDYARAGTTNISVIDADSYWIDGYFEETKMAHVCIGDRAEAELMGYRDPIVGQVESVTRGISVSKRSAEHPRPAKRRSGLHLGTAGATRAGAHPDHACSGWRPACFGYDCDSDDPRCRSAGKRWLVAAALRQPCGALERRRLRSATVSRTACR